MRLMYKSNRMWFVLRFLAACMYGAYVFGKEEAKEKDRLGPPGYGCDSLI